MFTGFTPDAWKFFRDLKRNNRKPWFLRERDRYESFIAAPATALASALNESRGFRKLGLHCTRPEKALFRLHRDLRFSEDKSPYKTYNGLTLSRSGDKKDTGSFYLHLDPEEFFAAVGFYQVESPLLQRFRTWVSEDPSAKKQIAALQRAKLHLMDEGSLVRLPRGYERVTDPVLQATLKLKHYVVVLPLTTKDLGSRALIGKLDRFVLKSEPLLRQGWKLLDAWRDQGGDPQWQQMRAKRIEKLLRLSNS